MRKVGALETRPGEARVRGLLDREVGRHHVECQVLPV